MQTINQICKTNGEKGSWSKRKCCFVCERSKKVEGVVSNFWGGLRLISLLPEACSSTLNVGVGRSVTRKSVKVFGQYAHHYLGDLEIEKWLNFYWLRGVGWDGRGNQSVVLAMSLHRLKTPPCLLYEWFWNPRDCLLR